MILRSFSMIGSDLAVAANGASQPARRQQRLKQTAALCGVKRISQRSAMTRPIPRQPAIQTVGKRLFVAVVVGRRPAGRHAR